MICTCIDHKYYSDICEIISREDVEMAEIRLDRCTLSDEEIFSIFNKSRKPLIATCRVEECGSESICKKRLVTAIDAGADFVDLEIEASESLSHEIMSFASEKSCRTIRSYHNFTNTPSLEELIQITTSAIDKGADIVKIVTTAHSSSDIDILNVLYQKTKNIYGRLIAFSMGEYGISSRFDVLVNGAPFTYCSISTDNCVAPGQVCYKNYNAKLYDGFCGYKNILVAPSSKSYAQRAIILAALTSGVSKINNFTICEDAMSALNIAKSMGSVIHIDGSDLIIEGSLKKSCPGCLSVIHTGESGFLTRMMIPLMSHLRGESFIITGEKTLVNRQLRGVKETMESFGVTVNGPNEEIVSVPISVSGKLSPANVEIDGSFSSQLISGLLMSLPLANESSKLIVHNPKSFQYLQMTIHMLHSFGVEVGYEALDDDIVFDIPGKQKLHESVIDIEGDWSGCSNFLVAGAIFGNVTINNLQNDSLQPDRIIVEILKEAGAKIILEKDVISVSKAPLRSFDISLDNAPDIIPIVALLAAFCPGRSKISGIDRLHDKESNRAIAITEALSQLGVSNYIEGNKISIDGETLSSRLVSGHMLKGGSYSSFHDHRIAMMLKVASIAASKEIIIDDIKCIDKSFPSFLKSFYRQ